MVRGQHLLITGPSPCPTPPMVYKFLIQCPLDINMTRITNPVIGWEEGSVSAIVIIAESHISVHHQRGVTYVDVFSCREFDQEPVEKLVKSLLGLTSFESQTIFRSSKLVKSAG